MWESALKDVLLPNYVPLRSHTLQAIHLICFFHKAIANLVTDIKSVAVATGIQNTLGNKGCVSIHISIQGTSLLVSTAHFAAGQKQIKNRNENFTKINQLLSIKLSKAKRFSLSTPSETVSPPPFSSGENTVFKTIIKIQSKGFFLNYFNLLLVSEDGDTVSDTAVPNDDPPQLGVKSLHSAADRVIFMGDLNYRINGER
jgi:hypothetical protein